MQFPRRCDTPLDRLSDAQSSSMSPRGSFFIRHVLKALVALGAIALPVHAQTPASPATAPPSQVLVSDQAPANITAWNRPLAVLRSSLGSTTAQQRADAASARIEAAIERMSPDEVHYSVVEVGSDRGAMIVAGAETLFAILDGDLPQDTATTLDTAGAQAVIRLQTLLRSGRTAAVARPRSQHR